MMKKAMFSILLASTFSLVMAQETVKTSKPVPVELNPEYKFSEVENKSIKIKAEPDLKEEKTIKKDEQPRTEPKPAEGATKPKPIKVTTNSKK